ncbi:MAG: hypothetical protein H0U92_05620 [Actinobacteria bacterium]|nr:hypothetical protein [Actinomycetota bacterium]
MHMRRPLSLLAALSAVAVLSAACGTDGPIGTSAKQIKQLPADQLDGPYLGLVPEREDVKPKLSEQEANAYIDSVGLYSLRSGERLEATLQISKLSDKARPDDPAFQQQVANQIGGTTVQSFVMDGRTVFRSSLRKQSLTSWFRGDYFMILAVRDTYKTPRSLLRVLLKEVTL